LAREEHADVATGTLPHAPSGPPPLVVFVPGIAVVPKNTARRVADILADEASLGPGTYASEKLPSDVPGLSDGGRVLTDDGEPVLDVLELEYRPNLLRSESAGTGPRALLHRLLLSLKYLVWAVVLLVGGGRRAKSAQARVQIVLGMLSLLALAVAFALTAVAILASLGIVAPGLGNTTDQDAGNGLARAVDVAAIGLTGFSTWLFLEVRPSILRTALLIEQLMDFVHDDRREASVARTLVQAVDRVIDREPGRAIYLLGYSLGSLVCLAFAFPRDALHVTPDERHATSLAGLITVGCPVDFVRLYVPDYLDARTARVPDLAWTNIFIGADVLASNFVDGDDSASLEDARHPVARMVMTPPVCLRYTSEELTWRTVWGRRGFLSHGGYWDEIGDDSCLRLVKDRLPAFAR
jgi:pimeloyl-ACP methyl ester carboxylesterase